MLLKCKQTCSKIVKVLWKLPCALKKLEHKSQSNIKSIIEQYKREKVIISQNEDDKLQ